MIYERNGSQNPPSRLFKKEIIKAQHPTVTLPKFKP